MLCSKWIQLSHEIEKEYDTKGCLCKICKRYKRPHFVHDITGYYTCFKCGKNGMIKQVCFTCR